MQKNLKQRDAAIEAAQSWMVQAPVFLDTETTGVKADDEVISIGIVDTNGMTLLDTLIRPRKSIPMQATSVHGITNRDVVNAPTMTETWPNLLRIIAGRLVVVYNAAFDMRLLFQSVSSSEKEQWTSETVCAMTLYAAFYGEWNSFYGSYKWQKLGLAAEQCGLTVPDNLHNAGADAALTQRVVEYMTKQPITRRYEYA